MRSLAGTRIVLIVVLSLLFASGVVAQNPTRMIVCESADDACLKANANLSETWQFDGTTGKILSSADTDGSTLTIQNMDQAHVIIRREDQAGANAGRSATYSGIIGRAGNGGTRITGSIQWEWPGHTGFPATGVWSAMLQGPSGVSASATGSARNPSEQGLPPVLLECEGGGPCNAAWIIDGQAGKATWFQQKPVRAELTVIRSDPDDLLIRRTDLTDGNSAVYYGTLRGNTYSGTVVWSGPGNPGRNSGHWSASVPQTQCNANAGLSSEDAMRIGRNALMFELQQDAFNCYMIAARGGDAMAQTAVGMLYYQGHNPGVPQNYPEALVWLRKAALQGVYAAQKTVADMYMLGQGTARDPELSRYFGDKAAEQKRDYEHKQERQEDMIERAKDRQANVLTGFVMGAAFGALFF